MSIVRRLSERIRKSFRRRPRPGYSTADTVDARPVKKGCIRCKIALLDGSDLTIDVEKKALGQDLVKKVLMHLDLVEKDYFGLQFMDTKQVPHWLDPTKKVIKQVKIGPPYTLHFRVKFYAAEPESLHEELTRYHYFLQIKQDILRGKLTPTFEQMAGLGAYAVQSELGDFDRTLHIGNYVSEFRFMPDQTGQLEARIERQHKQLLGINPAECELEFLKIAKDLENYGVDMHPVEDIQGKECQLGLSARGILIYKDNQRVAGHPWPKITNIAFHKKEFVMAAEKQNGNEEFRFALHNSRASKHLWKCAVEYHTFFRMTRAAEPVKRRSSFLSFGSKFRYSGRTLHQAKKDDSVNARKSLHVKRTRSERYAQRSTIGYIRIGSNVWAKSFNGDYYRGQVTALSEKVYIKFDNGDTIAHDRTDEECVVFDMDPNPSEVEIGSKVIAHWSGLSAMLRGTIEKKEGEKYFVLYDDGDKAYNRIQQIRILKPPLYFGPGSGSSRIQKRLSMKATSLIGDARTSTSADDNLGSRSQKGGEVTVTADVVPDRRINSRPDKTSVKSNRSDTSEFDSMNANNGSRPPNNGSDANSNGYRNRDQPQRGSPNETGSQKWYTHVKTSEIAEERQPLAQERTDGSSHYKVVQKTTRTTRSHESSYKQRANNGNRAEPAFVTEL
ncbi:band 4.1-like protein 5 isoform X2 [Rhopilema esculentum]|uniref:band 4.1-like protein 5 isoform X2 n=1 Tax=Rhopilema esculentum TaxID=499914 RepID=UPI0031DBC184